VLLIATALAATSNDAKLILCMKVDDSCFLAAAAADEDALKSVFELKILHQAYCPIRNS